MRLRIIFSLLILFATSLSGETKNRPLATVPFETVENLIFLRVQINDSRPLWFVLDSGASGCVIEKQYANQLGLKTEGYREGKGAGAGKIQITYTENILFSLGDFKTKVPQVMVIDFAGLSKKLGHECAGLLGYDFFKSYIVMVDYDSRVVRFYHPGKYRYSGDGEVLPVEIKKNLPYIRLHLAVPGVPPKETELLVDSGSADSVDSELIAKSAGNKYEAVGGIGLGEPFNITLGTYETVRVGKMTLKNVHGASGASLVGGDFLHRFRVIFDYSRKQLILEPSRHFEDETLLNLSGMDLESVPQGNAFQITGTLQGFAAEKAGLRAGDRIVAIDGQPASNFTWEQAVRLLHQNGQEYWLTIQRDKEIKEIHLVIPEKKS